MKKMIFFLLTVAIVIVTSCVPREVRAQDDVSYGNIIKKDTTAKKKFEKTKKQDKSFYCLPNISIGIANREGILFKGSGKFVSGTQKIIPFYLGGFVGVGTFHTYSCGGLFCKSYFIPGKIGRIFGLGIEAAHFSKTYFGGYAELYYGGKLSNTFGENKTFVQLKSIVICGTLDVMIPIRNCRIGIDCKVGGYSEYFPKEKTMGVVRRFYDISLKAEFTLLPRYYKAFRERQVK